MSRFDWLGDVTPYLPPAFGALVGLTNAGNQTPVQKTVGFVGGFGLAVWFGPAAAELIGLGPKATIAAGILIAIVGMDIAGGLLAAAAAFKADPVRSFKQWWGAWWNRGGQS